MNAAMNIMGFGSPKGFDFIKSYPAKPITSNLFSAVEEFKKMEKIIAAEPATYSTRQNEEDFKHMDFGKFEAGFFVVSLPLDKNGGIQASSEEARAIMANFKVSKVGKNAMFSTYCTFDRVKKHLDDVADNFLINFVGFSTPRHLMILGENVL